MDVSKRLEQKSTGPLLRDVVVLLITAFGCLLVPFELSFTGRGRVATTLILYLGDLLLLAAFLRGSTQKADRQGRMGPDSRSRLFHLAANVPIDALFAVASWSIAGIPVVLILRLNRLLRVVYVYDVLSKWESDRRFSSGLTRILKLLSTAPLLLHLIASAWHLVPALESSPADSWLEREGIAEAAVETRYVRSVYWAIVTMTTVGYGDITPGRNSEYVFTMIVMVTGASVYALIIAMLASLIGNRDSARVAFWSKVDGMNLFLRSRGVQAPLLEKLNTYYSYVWTNYRGADLRSALKDLPESIRLGAIYEIADDLLDKVPLLAFSSPPLRDALLLSLEPKVFIPGSSVVRAGDVADGLYFLSRGELGIFSGSDRENAIETLEAGDYFGDLSLLLGERRTGSAIARSFCDILFLSIQDFERIRELYPELRDAMKEASARKSEKMAQLLLSGIIL
jgi:hypothetical protein